MTGDLGSELLYHVNVLVAFPSAEITIQIICEELEKEKKLIKKIKNKNK